VEDKFGREQSSSDPGSGKSDTTLTPTVATVELLATPLPPNPGPYEEWRSDRPDYLRTYDMVFAAERHADEQVKANPSDRKAKDNLTSARVAGYLLVELFNRHTILSEGPCVSIVKHLEPKSGDKNDLVFRIDEGLCGYFIPLCALNPILISSGI